MRDHRLPKERAPTHPGEILRQEFLEPMGLSITELAERLGVPRPRMSEIVNERRGVSTETALLLAKAFDTTAEFWMNAQRDCELWEALHGEAAEKLERVERITG